MAAKNGEEQAGWADANALILCQALSNEKRMAFQIILPLAMVLATLEESNRRLRTSYV